MKIVSFLFQVVAVAMPLEKFPGYPEKFKILNPFEKKFMECMGDAGGATVLIGLKCLQTGMICDPVGFVFKREAFGT
jgi:hypothetical protein